MSTTATAPSAADRLEQHIQKVLDEAPPLSTAQRARLASLLHPAAPVIAASTPNPAHDNGSRLPAGAAQRNRNERTRSDATA